MREQNYPYIINLAEDMVGKHIVASLKDRVSDPHDLFLFLSPHIESKVKKMTAETLGRICAYGFYPGGSMAREPLNPQEIDLLPLASFRDFVFGTGIKDVHPDSFGSGRSGRRILEQVAIATIIAVINDIIHQDEYQMKRTE